MHNAIIVAGSGRSGTTWVQDAIAEANCMQTLFEPLHPIGVPWSKGLGYRFLQPDESADDLKEFLDKALEGRMKSLWANYRIRPDRFNPLKYRPGNILHNIKKTIHHFQIYRPGLINNPKGLVVKFIRANLMLHWIERHYNNPILLVIRHPAAVAASALRIDTQDWSAELAIKRYTDNSLIVNHIQDQYNFDIRQQMSTASTLACVWCVENMPILDYKEKSRIIIATYEELLAYPDSAWRHVCAALELEHIPDANILAAPSQQSDKSMRNRTFDPSHLGKWQKTLQPAQLDEIAWVLDAFGVKIYTIDDYMPTRKITKHTTVESELEGQTR